MGTEIFPSILFLAKCIVGAIGLIGVLLIIIALIQHTVHKTDQKVKDEMKEHIVTGLMAITIALIAYFILIGFGPVFKLLFVRA